MAQVQPLAYDNSQHNVFKRRSLAVNGFTSCARSQRWKRDILANSYEFDLDRVNVLGNDTFGHTGQVPS